MYYKLKYLFISIILFSFLVVAGNAFAFDGKSGWWYTPGEDGTGVSVEVRGTTAFVALFTYYDDTRLPFWISSVGSIETGVEDKDGRTADIFTGPLQYWIGWPVGTAYAQPATYNFGSLRIVFNSDSNAELSYTVEGFTSGGSGGKKKTDDVQPEVYKAKLTKFMQDVSPGRLDSRDINGWWFDPNYNGMGFFLEARGGTVFMTWYHYHDNKLPWWWTCTASLGSSDTQFSCDLQEWQGGSSIGAEEYHRPTPTSVGSAVFSLNADGTAVFSWSGQQFHLQRFVF